MFALRMVLGTIPWALGVFVRLKKAGYLDIWREDMARASFRSVKVSISFVRIFGTRPNISIGNCKFFDRSCISGFFET